MKFRLAVETFHVSFVKSLSHIRWKAVTASDGGRGEDEDEDADPTDDGGNSEITFSISRNIEAAHLAATSSAAASADRSAA